MEGCSAFDMEASEDLAASGDAPAHGNTRPTDADRPSVAVNDIVRLSVQRNKTSYNGYEAQVIALRTREVKVVLLEVPQKGEPTTFLFSALS